MTIVVAAALTLGPALISIVTRFGKVLEPKGNGRARGWRRSARRPSAGPARSW